MFTVINTLKLKILERLREYLLSCSARLKNDELFNAFKIIRH